MNDWENQINLEKYKSLFTYNPDLVYSFNLEGLFTDLNYTVQEVLGYSYEEMIHQPYLSIVTPEFQSISAHHFEEAKKGFPQKYELDVVNKKGELIHLLATKFPIVIKGEVVGLYGIAKDVTKERRILKDFYEAEEKFRKLVENSLAGVYIIENDTFLYTNPKANEILGKELEGTYVYDVVYPEDQEFVRKSNSQLIEKGSVRYETRLVNRDGEIIYVEIIATKSVLNGKDVLLGTFLDKTSQIYATEKNEKLTNFDYLTGVMNRHKFENDMERYIKGAAEQQEIFALLHIDFNRFKYVNDTYGHKGGDQLLIQISKRMSSILLRNQYLYRIGGDEFAIVMTDVKEKEEVVQFVNELLTIFELSFTIENSTVFINPSVGVSLYPENAKNKEELMIRAEVAMNYAKQGKSEMFVFYNSTLENRVFPYARLESDLRKAIQHKNFTLVYQPRVNSTGKLIGAEALIRWNHPERGFISPDLFIPFAEEAGIIYQIDCFVQEEVFKQVRHWEVSGYQVVPISINYSANTIKNPNLVPSLEKLISRYSINPRLIEVELTETSLLTFTEATLDTLSKMKKLGLSISLDDFGKGYSSLSYLHKFKDIISILKIDKSFIQNIVENTDLVNSIIYLAKQLNMAVVAEGIETEEQYKCIQTTLCDALQGYYFSKPLKVSEFTKWLGRR
ncbi:EAL domain-containing protein [Fredinandcohnia humi]